MNIPNTIRYHLAEIEIQLIQFMIFSSKFSQLAKEEIKNYLLVNKDNEQYTASIEDLELSNQSLFMFMDFKGEISDEILSYKSLSPMKIILKKVLCYMLILNQFINRKMKNDISIALKVECLIKEIVCSVEYFHILFEKHLDQIVLYCIITVLSNETTDANEDIINNVIINYAKSKPDNENKSIYEEIRLPSLSTARMSISEQALKQVSLVIDGLYNSKIKLNETKVIDISNSNESYRQLKHKESLTTSHGADSFENPKQKSLFLLKDLSAYTNGFTGYHYFFKTVFHAENLNVYSRSGISPMRTPTLS